MVVHQEQDVDEAVAGFLQAIGPMTARELSDEIGIDISKMNRVLGRMYSRRRVEREEIDRRTKLPARARATGGGDGQDEQVAERGRALDDALHGGVRRGILVVAGARDDRRGGDVGVDAAPR